VKSTKANSTETDGGGMISGREGSREDMAEQIARSQIGRFVKTFFLSLCFRRFFGHLHFWSPSTRRTDVFSSTYLVKGRA
jgi:hypothetical protein